jgi:hypothetical protein
MKERCSRRNGGICANLWKAEDKKFRPYVDRYGSGATLQLIAVLDDSFFRHAQ